MAAILAGLVVASLLVSDGIAESRTPVSNKPTTGMRLGEVATMRDRFGNVVNVTVESAQLRIGCDAQGFSRILNQENVYADVTVTVVRGTWTIDLANFFLTDRPVEPGVWQFGPTGRDCGADLPEGTMEAGATRRGHLALLVLDDPVPSQIGYAAGGTPPASWKMG